MLQVRSFILVLTLLMSWQAVAGNFDFVPSGGGPEKEFQSLINAGNYRQALVAWTAAHSGSRFGRSQDGIATYSYLLYQNAMPYTALDLMFRHTQPSKLDPQLLKLWSTELKSSKLVQKGWISTAGAWSSVVNNQSVHLNLKNKRETNLAFSKAARLPKDQINAKARIWWQIATNAPQHNDTTSALKALKLLTESGQTVIGQDLVHSVYGRVLYQKGDLTAAQEQFKQIPKSSSLWVESVEEKAWADLRRDDFDQALGEVTTLMSPALAPLVGPESYFLSNLMSLKICDYTRLFKTSELFKKRHRDRLVDLETLAKTGTNKNLNAVFANFETSGVSAEVAGPLVVSVPRQTYRDAKFVRYMELRRQLLSEISKAKELAELSSPLGGAAEFHRFETSAQSKADAFRQLAYNRVRVLAKSETAEYRQILDKMHILEAEVIERLHLDESLKGRRSKLAKVDDSGDVLVFPINSSEVWFDELDNYKARVKDCPTLKGASL